MNNQNDSKCFEYISNQIKAYVVNRLANAPCTTAQLVGTFSMLVEQLSVSESSIVNVLDALYKEKVINFSLVNNNTRLYSLINFNKDYIFELNIQKVEQMIAEYKLPYFSDHRKNVDYPLYFEARKNRTCIYLNALLTISDESEKVTLETTIDINSEDKIDMENLDENINNNSDLSPTENFDTSSEDYNVSDDIEESLTTENQEETINDNVDAFKDEQSFFNSNDYHKEYKPETVNSSILSTSPFTEKSEEFSNENNSNDSENIFLDKNVTIENNSTDKALIEDKETTDSTPIISNESDKEILNTSRKSNFDSIDFSSLYNDSENYVTDASVSNGSEEMDIFERQFKEALAKAMAQSNASENEIINTLETSQEREIVTNSDEDIKNSKDNTLNIDNSNSATVESSEEFSSQNVSKNSYFENPNLNNNVTSQDLAGDIVFTELQESSVNEIDPNEERERQERALRVMQEILENTADTKENAEPEPEPEFQFEEINDKIEVECNTNSSIINAEKDELTLYIKEQERINNYDWHNRLKRALVDVIEEPVEVSEEDDEAKLTSTYSELKTLMANKNYVFKSYPSHESKSFYTENYVFSNRLSRSTSLFTYLFLLAEIFLAFFFVDPIVNKGLPFYIIASVVLAVIPLFFIIKYLLFRDKRKPANFAFGLSLVTAMMIYINLMVMVVLVAFFIPSLQVDVNNVKTMILTIFYPAGLFLGIPVSVCIYAILYRSKRYHLH